MSVAPKYVGFHETAALPIKEGDTVTIQKGTLIKVIGRDAKLAGKTFTVKVNHILMGSSEIDTVIVREEGSPARVEKVCKHTSNPTVVWAGGGGLWTEVDINDVLG